MFDVFDNFIFSQGLRLWYENVDPTIPQLGVIYLVFTSEFELNGYFAGLFIDVPEKRVKPSGTISLSKIKGMVGDLPPIEFTD